MSEMKDNRIKMLIDCLDGLEKLKNQYMAVSPGWILINTAQGHIKSVHYLEAETHFDEEILGVKEKESE